MSSEPKTRITLLAFRAPDRPDLCREFLAEHRKVLEDFGIAHVPANNDRWVQDQATIVIVAMHDTLGMVGGIRLQAASAAHKLPMELSIEKLDPRIHDVLEELRSHRNGEVCGLWNARRFAGKGIPVLLTQAIAAVSAPADFKKMVCFVAHYTQRLSRRIGFVPMEGVGDMGVFPSYPIPRISAMAMVHHDPLLVEHASIEQRRLIFSLRSRPEQIRVETPSGEALEVHYRLSLNVSDAAQYDRNPVVVERLRSVA